MRGVMIDLPYKLGMDTGLVDGVKLNLIEFQEGEPHKSSVVAKSEGDWRSCVR